MSRHALVAATVCLCVCVADRASAQSTAGAPAAERPWGRVSFFTNSSETHTTDGASTRLSELSTAFSYQLPDVDRNRADYGVDIRHAAYTSATQPDRVSIYEAFAGARMADGAVRFRLGHVWLTDVGSLGSVAGTVIEVAQKRTRPESGRFRGGVFGGFEPDVLQIGYAPHVRKFGGYLTYDGGGSQRNSIGFVTVRNRALTERSVLTTTNFVPVGQKLFIYQSAEYDVVPPAGQATRGLAQLFTTVRVLPASRLDLQATYSRNRSVDVRGLSEDILAGRPVSPLAVEGFLYESVGGRVTVEVVRRVRVYGGYSRDRNDRDSAPSGRTLVGGYASNVLDSGLDITASDALFNRPTGSYHSDYVSIGRQLGRTTYLSIDYSNSLSVVRFDRSDGITVETRPHTTRASATATVNLRRSMSLLMTVERSKDDGSSELRLLSGLTYRIR